MVTTETIERTAFDYGVLEDEVGFDVKSRTAEIHTLVRMTSQAVIKIGRKLTEVKPLLAGHFIQWLNQEFSWSERTALNFITAYKAFGDEQEISKFAPSALYALSAPSVPDETRRAAIQIAADGEKVTHKKATALIRHSYGVRVGRPHKTGPEPQAEPKGFASLLTAEPETKDSPQLFYVNKLRMAIENGYLDLKEDRLTYALHGLAELIKERVPLHPPK